MKIFITLALVLLFGCATKEDSSAPTKEITTQTNTSTTPETLEIIQESDTIAIDPPPPIVIKKPSGIYQFFLPYKDDQKIQHTVSFSGNSYELQERYFKLKGDSVDITKGTWSPSDGYIWLYKDGVVRARYIWKGDTLKYFSPKNNVTYAMNRMPRAIYNAVLARKASEGYVIYGVGTEPFWSIELNKEDSLIFNNPEWTQPVKVKLDKRRTSKDSMIYTGQSDSLSLKVIVLPYFCSDGMSDFIYSSQITIHFEGKTYRGCGIRYK